MGVKWTCGFWWARGERAFLFVLFFWYIVGDLLSECSNKLLELKVDGGEALLFRALFCLVALALTSPFPSTFVYLSRRHLEETWTYTLQGDGAGEECLYW